MIMMRRENVQKIIKNLEKDLDLPFYPTTREAIEVAMAQVVKQALDDLKVDYGSWSETISSAEDKVEKRTAEDEAARQRDEDDAAAFTREEEREWEKSW